MLGTNYMQAIGKAKETLILILLRKIILLLPLVLVLPIFMGVDGILFSQPITDILSVIIIALLLKKTITSYRKV